MHSNINKSICIGKIAFISYIIKLLPHILCFSIVIYYYYDHYIFCGVTYTFIVKPQIYNTIIIVIDKSKTTTFFFQG